MELQGLILAGGRGERFWPLSRPERPKQLLHLIGEQSMLRATWDRLRQRLDPTAIWVVTASALIAAIKADLPEVRDELLVPEVVGRNTAPALAVAAALAVRGGANPIQLILPSDHWIPDPNAFWQSVERALNVVAAADSPLVTFGIPIAYAATGYGYIERGSVRPDASEAWNVAQFHEKPDEATALTYQESGSYFWNSGIFLWRARAFLEEVAKSMPVLRELVRPLETAENPGALLDDIFRKAPAESVDFGLLEHSQRVAVVAAGFDWSDVGTWASWGDLAAGDAARNAVRGEVCALETEGSVLFAEQGRIVTLGIKDLVVVRTGEVTLVMPRERSQEVKAILKALEQEKS